MATKFNLPFLMTNNKKSYFRTLRRRRRGFQLKKKEIGIRKLKSIFRNLSAND